MCVNYIDHGPEFNRNQPRMVIWLYEYDIDVQCLLDWSSSPNYCPFLIPTIIFDHYIYMKYVMCNV